MCTTLSSMCERLEGAWLYFVLIDHIEVPPIGHMLFIIIVVYHLLSFSLPFELYILNWSNDRLRWPEGFLKVQTCPLGGRSFD